MKISVVEIKKYKYFEYQNQQLFEAIKQGARYAKRHRTPFIMAFDGCKLVLAKHIENSNMIIIIFNIDISSVEPDMNLFHFTHYGIFRCPDCEVSSFKYDAENDEGLFKDHKGEKLPISSYAYVGDIRNKSTWKLPYRHPDGKVNTDRIGKAVAYLLNPAGYRGKKATDEKLPVGATTLVALRLAKAYKEIDQWKRPNVIFRSNEKPNSQEMLWLYLYQKGIEDLLE